MKTHHLIPAILFGVLLPISAGTERLPSSVQDEARPNIVVILADDLGCGSLGCYGGHDSNTPHIDKLAADGVRFTDFHSNGPFCSPTRAALMTGRYPQRCAWVEDEDLSPVFREQRAKNLKQRWAWGISPKEVTLPALLKQAGYRTGIIGKWHLGYDVAFHPMNFGFEGFRGFMGGNVDYHTHVAGYGMKQLDWWKDHEVANEQGYATDLLTRHATEFIERNKERPFFLYLAHGAPHDPWQGRNPKSKASKAGIYREMIGVLDESVGKIVETLRQHHLEKNTLLIFCSDNGAAPPPGVPANGGLRGRKGSLLEGGHRVPCMVSWSGVIAGGSTRDEVAMTMDFLPTIAALAGAKIPAGHVIDGVDLMPQLKGGKAGSERVLHWLSGEEWAVRKGPWKLLGRGKDPTVLVHLRDDPDETDNRLVEQPGVADELAKLHRQWIHAVGEK